MTTELPVGVVSFTANAWKTLRVATAALAVALAAGASLAQPLAGSASALRSAWSRLAQADGDAPAPPPAVMSAQASGMLTGSLHGVLDEDFGEVTRALAGPDAWCEVLILDPNIHGCRSLPASGVPAEARVAVAFGEAESPLVMDFTHKAGTDYLQVRLAADEGPFGTRDYAMTLEAAPLGAGRSVLQLAFAQHVGLAARLAMHAYFSTVGRGKVGFTVVGRDAAGRPVLVGDLRGGVERNLVRQWLALDAYLATRQVARSVLPEQRVRHWLAGTERFPDQLREAPGYLARKMPEVRRQLAGD